MRRDDSETEQPTASDRGGSFSSETDAAGRDRAAQAADLRAAVSLQRDVDVETAGWIALALEVVFGWFGILGLGHAYAGNLVLGVGLFLGWLVALGLLTLLTLVSLGIAGCVTAPVWIGAPVVSGLLARRTVLASRTSGSWGRAAAFGAAGCGALLLLACLVVAGLTSLGIGLSALMQ